MGFSRWIANCSAGYSGFVKLPVNGATLIVFLAAEKSNWIAEAFAVCLVGRVILALDVVCSSDDNGSGGLVCAGVLDDCATVWLLLLVSTWREMTELDGVVDASLAIGRGLASFRTAVSQHHPTATPR
jgi:hypothetical protein